MLVLVITLPLLSALLGLALNRAVATRWLGFGAAAAVLVCAGGVLLARIRAELPLTLLDQDWVTVENQAFTISLRLDQANWVLALLALAGGGLALLTLALALPNNLRGFGGLFSTATLALLALAAGLINQSQEFLPFLWALAALMSFLALRSSGALASSDAPAIVLLSGMWGALVLLGAVLLAALTQPGTPALQVMLVLWVVVGLLALGGPPFHTPFVDLAEAPAALVGALLPVGLPLLGGYALIRFFAGLGGALSPGWQLALTLLGLIVVVVCAAGAAGAARLRQLIGWQLSAQLGVLFVAAGQGGMALSAAAPALLANGALAALGCLLALACLERRAGTDVLHEIALHEPLALPGAVFLVAAAAGVGLPGTWGFWPRLWLVEELGRAAPWAIAPLLAGSTLLGLTYVAPLAAFWRSKARDADERSALARALPLGAAAPGAVVAAALVLLGVFPRVGWDAWLAPAQSILAQRQPAPPALPGALGQIACAAAALSLAGISLLAGHRRTRAELPGTLAPHALGESLRWLGWLAAPREIFARLWEAQVSASRALRRGLSFFEQRYYLAGLLIAVIIVIMLFIQ